MGEGGRDGRGEEGTGGGGDPSHLIISWVIGEGGGGGKGVELKMIILKYFFQKVLKS